MGAILGSSCTAVLESYLAQEEAHAMVKAGTKNEFRTHIPFLCSFSFRWLTGHLNSVSNWPCVLPIRFVRFEQLAIVQEYIFWKEATGLGCHTDWHSFWVWASSAAAVLQKWWSGTLAWSEKCHPFACRKAEDLISLAMESTSLSTINPQGRSHGIGRAVLSGVQYIWLQGLSEACNMDGQRSFWSPGPSDHPCTGEHITALFT